MMTRKFFLLIVLCIVPVLSWAQTAAIPEDHPGLYRGVRQLGMGNAGLALPGKDEGSPFYNPAAIPDFEKKLHFRILSPVVDFTPKTIGLVSDVLDLADDLDATNDTSGQTDIFEAFVDQHIGEFHHIGFRMPILAVTHKWFFVSTLADSRSSFSFRNRTFTNMEINSRSDGGAAIGSGYSFLEDQLQVGLMVKVLHRVAINEVITTTDIITNADFSDTFTVRRGTGVGFDLGAKGKIPTFEVKALEFLKPTAGFTWQDIANTRFSGDAPNTEQSISTGLAVNPTFPLFKKDWEAHFAVDIREINQPSSFPKKLFLGAELQAPKFLFITPSLRAGANQLYYTVGTTLDMRFFKLDFAYYGVEVGQFTRQAESRRLVANLSFGF